PIALVTLLVGIAIVLFCGFYFFYDFNPLELEQAERTVTAKHSELRQSLLPKYYLLVNNEAGTDPSLQRISKSELFSVQTGDVISGYEKDGIFYTGRQFLSDVTLLIGFTVGGLIRIPFCLSILFRKKPFVKKIRRRMRDFFQRMPSGTGESWKYLLLPLAAIWVFGGYGLHFFQIHFTPHQETTAEILEVARDPGYGRFIRTSYYFTFYYEQDENAVIVETKVGKDMYDAYTEGNKVKLWLKESNPYYAYTPREVNSSLKQMFSGE